MQRFNGNASCVDDGSEHPHRVSLSIRSDVLHDFLKQWGEGLNRAGVQVRGWGEGGRPGRQHAKEPAVPHYAATWQLVNAMHSVCTIA
jgi:hypothetical protein